MALQNASPCRGRCTNGQTPFEFAFGKGLTDAIGEFATSPHPDVQSKLLLKMLEKERFASLKRNPGYLQDLNRSMKSAACWDKDIFVPFFQELTAHVRHVGAHFFDVIGKTMHDQNWQQSTQSGTLKKFVRGYGCLTAADSSTTARMYEAIFRFAERSGDHETKAALF